MFPYSQPQPGPPSGQAASLEDRLRGLILNNVNSDTGGQPSSLPLSQQLPPQIPTISQLPQQEYAANLNAQTQTHTQATAEIASIPVSPSLSRKRPNQAQRRQLNSQLSIPIDPRPAANDTQVRQGPGYYHSSNQTRVQQNLTGPPSMHQNQRYQQNTQYSPRSQNSEYRYSPRSLPTQPSSQSSMYQYQSGPGPQFQQRQGPAQFQTQTRSNYGRPPPQNRQLYRPGSNYYDARRPMQCSPEEITLQSNYLQGLVQEHVPRAGVAVEEKAEKEAFRALIEQLCREAIAGYEQQELGNKEFNPSTVELQCFGSMKSGFATKASDMDLALLSPESHPAPDAPESTIPRLLEKKLLRHGYGARLLTKTRVPIIKLCEKPSEKLLSDLLEARTKWENGFVDDEDDDLHEIEESAKTKGQSKEGKDGSPSSPDTRSHRPEDKGEEYELKLTTLIQKDSQSLVDYYNSAKRLLRKLGGREITTSSPDLNEKESKILNDVCKAFISGLSSEALSTSLRTYSSILPLYDSSLPFLQRTLQGIWIQIDGERLALNWNTRPVTEHTDNYDNECLGVVQAWRDLQNKTGAFTESFVYIRALTQASDKLKRISSLQLCCLEQIQNEDPQFYYQRAHKLEQDLLRGQNTQHIDSVRDIIIAHYIAGINNDRIKEALQNKNYARTTLQQVSLDHRALQLAIDYEHASKVGAFKDTDKEDVEHYVALLQSLQYKPRTDVEAALLTRIRALPDPTTISLNKAHDRYNDHLEFPKTNIGIQCDLNFSALLAIHNTQLLRCYSQCDPRVKEIILFVKNWAKVRGVNTPYRGTLSSYGYVLMVLHYLVNVVQPFVCPNLQLPPAYSPPVKVEGPSTCNGWNVQFWRNEAQIKQYADNKMLNQNHDSVGTLLRGFFEYYGQSQLMTTITAVPTRGFDYGLDVLSLRTSGGLLTKKEKGWIGAKTSIEVSKIAAPPTPSTPLPPTNPEGSPTPGEAPPVTPKLATKTIEEKKEIRHRYLFAIEDPFELNHNVARTVTHNGICAMRDELRRAWRIIRSIGTEQKNHEGGILDALPPADDGKDGLSKLMDLLHGPAVPNATIKSGEVEGGKEAMRKVM